MITRQFKIYVLIFCSILISLSLVLHQIFSADVKNQPSLNESIVSEKSDGNTNLITQSRDENKDSIAGHEYNKSGASFDSLRLRLLERPSIQSQKNALSALLPSLLKVNGVDACSGWVATQLKGNMLNYANGIIVGTLLRDKNPVLAAKIYNAMPFSPERSQHTANVASQFVKTDYASACDWYIHLPDSERQYAFEGFRRELTHRRDIGGLTGLLQIEAKRSDHEAAVRSIVGIHLADENTGSIENLFRNIDPELADVAREAVVVQGKYNSISDVAPKLQLLRTIESRVRAICSVTAALTRVDPSKTANGALALSDEYKLPALRSVIQAWTRFDPNSTSEWISGIQDKTSRDVAIRTFVALIQSKDPDSARDSAQSISDPMLRKLALDGIPQR